MAYCPVCKTEIAADATTCYVCGSDLNDKDSPEWVVIGTVEDKLSADFAKETLESCNIPAVVFSRSGFFGSIGLPLNPFYKSKSAEFEVSVPKQFREDAADTLEMTLGEKWQRKED